MGVGCKTVVTWRGLLPDAASAIADELLFEAGLTTSVEDDGGDVESECQDGDKVAAGVGAAAWSRCKVVAFVEDEALLEEAELFRVLESASANAGHAFDRSAVHISAYEDSEFRHWSSIMMRDAYQPTQISPRVRVVPLESLESGGEQAAGGNGGGNGFDIFIAPGLAFGKGEHETTQLCLQWLDANGSKVEGKRVIDYGSGSGVLAVAAAKFGAASVLATDIEEASVAAIATNADLNSELEKVCALLVDHAQVLGGRCEGLGGSRAQCLLANILMTPLVELEETFAGLVESGGDIVLSGVLTEQVPRVKDKYSKHFTGFGEAQLGEWALLTAVRK